MAATFSDLRNFLSFLFLFIFRLFLQRFFILTFFVYWTISVHGRNDVFLAPKGAHVSFLIDLSLLGTFKHGCTCLLLPSRDLTICMDIESNPGPPYSLLNAHLSAVSFDSMPARRPSSTTSIGLVNVFARKVYTREELFSIRAQSHRWSNNFLYYRLKSLGIFKYRGWRSGFSSKLRLRTNNQAIPAICSRRCREDACASYNIRQTFGSARLARKPSLNLITILEDFEDENGSFEVLWIKLHPTRLPRGTSSNIAGIVYHPPKATNSMMLDYLTKCLMELESKYRNCGLLVLGDFNHLKDARFKSNFTLKQIVHFPSRGQNTLDKILSNLQDYYDTPVERPAFDLSDHSSVEVQPKERVKTSQTIQTVISRDLRPSNRLAMRTYLYEVDVTAMIRAMTTCEEKVSMLQTIIKTGLDFVLPIKPKIVLPNRTTMNKFHS